MATKGIVSRFRPKTKRSRKGIHSKNKQSKNKHSKNYFKINVGQGK